MQKTSLKNNSKNPVRPGIYRGKEWFRKRLVALKRAPQNIPFAFLFLCCALYFIWLFTFSRSVTACMGTQFTGLLVFLCTLLSLLSVALFLSAFPKRKKANPWFVALLFVFMAGMIACDVGYYCIMKAFVAEQLGKIDTFLVGKEYVQTSFIYAIVHASLVGVSALSLAFLPLYRRWINKIDTVKKEEPDA